MPDITGRETLCRSVKNAGYTVDGAIGLFAFGLVALAFISIVSLITCAGVTTYKAVK